MLKTHINCFCNRDTEFPMWYPPMEVAPWTFLGRIPALGKQGVPQPLSLGTGLSTQCIAELRLQIWTALKKKGWGKATQSTVGDIYSHRMLAFNHREWSFPCETTGKQTGRPQTQNNYQNIQKQLCFAMYQHQYFNGHLMTDILRLELQLNIWNDTRFVFLLSLLFCFPLDLFFNTPRTCELGPLKNFSCILYPLIKALV